MSVAQSVPKTRLCAPGSVGGSQPDMSFSSDADSKAAPGTGYLPSPLATGLSHQAEQPFQELVHEAKVLWDRAGRLRKGG